MPLRSNLTGSTAPPQAGLLKNRELSMTSSWCVSPEYLSTISDLGMREQQFGFSITPVDYMQARVELAAGRFLREDQTFYVMKSCRAPGGEQIYSSASHIIFCRVSMFM